MLQTNSKKIQQVFEFSGPKNWSVILFLSFAVLSLFFPDQEKSLVKPIKAEFKNHYFLTAEDYSSKAFDSQNFGGNDMLNYIQQNVSYGAVFESNTAYRNLEMVADVHMAAWPERSQPERELTEIYENNANPELKLECLSFYQVDYLLVTRNKKKSKAIDLSNISVYLTAVHQNSRADLYLVDQDKIKNALAADPSTIKDLQGPLDCRAPQWKK